MKIEVEGNREEACQLARRLGEQLAPDDSAEETLQKLRKLRSEIASEGDIRRRVHQLEALRERAREAQNAD